MTELAEGAQAPDFDMPVDGGGSVSLKELRGKSVVLYFYPKDDTSGCTKEAISFSGLKDDFEAANSKVIGVSPDSIKSHEKFKTKHDLTVMLASDEEKKTVQDYGVWVEKSMYGRKYMGVERATFLIGPDGSIAKVWRKVKVAGHAEKVLEEVKAL
ncbi:MAG: peroxiredoxin [Pseudomonadota bacterium]